MSWAQVHPRFVQANGLAGNLFTGKKKWRITCGRCDHEWDEKVPVRESCSAACPSCGAQNLWSLSRFAAEYDLAKLRLNRPS